MGKQKVSIVTVTQWSRRDFLPILADMIRGQTYKSILEWVIVEGSRTEADGRQNAAFIEDSIRPSMPFPVHYVPYKGNPKIGFLRNQGNRVCQGDVVVCMDDDDYYFPTRVQHAVEELSMSRRKLAGCSALILYDWNLDKLYKFRGFGPNHSTNACMAWKQQYVKNHDDTKETAEEASFTDNFTTPMIQLDPFQVMVVNSHSQNTFNKRELLVGATLGLNHTCEELTSHSARELMGVYYDRYKALLWEEEEYSPFDVVFYMGGFGKQLNPDSLTGTEQAVVRLSEEWTGRGKRVAVYAQIDKQYKYQNVEYFSWKDFNFHKRYKTVILWRIYGYMCAAPFRILADNLLADLQDAFLPPTFEGRIVREYDSKITRYIFKTHFHAGFFQHQTGIDLSQRQYSILPNGIDMDVLQKQHNSLLRQPYRFCYTTCYTKGLEKILQYIWPAIHAALPESEFHIYSGMDHIQHTKFHKTMAPLLSQAGVVDHGKQPIHAVMQEKQRATFYLFPTDFPNDADSINLKECYALGCIPILSNYLLYKDMDGVHFHLGAAEEKDYLSIANEVITLARQESTIATLRQEIMNKKKMSWRDAAEAWLPYL